MKNIIAFIIFFSSTVTVINSQEILTKSLTPSTVKHVKLKVSFESSGGPNYYFSSAYHVGSYFNSGNYSDTWASGYYFPLNDLPPQEYIKDIEIKIIWGTSTSSSTEATLRKLPNNAFSSNPGTIFNEIYDADVEHTWEFPDTLIEDVKSDVLNNISVGYIKYGMIQPNNVGYSYDKRSTIHSIKLIVTYEEYAALTVQNKMDDYGGGMIGIGENTSNISDETSPYQTILQEEDVINMRAKEQQSYNGYTWIWNDTEAPINKSQWEKSLQGLTFELGEDQTTSYEVLSGDHGSLMLANLKKVCEISFKNKHSGGEVGGSIKVNGTIYTSPTSDFNLVELNGITGEAVNHSINGIDFRFSSWSDGGGTSYTHTYTPSTHKDYEAIFTGRPNNYYRNQYFNPKVVGQPIKVYWSQHPNTNVTQYKVYRKPKYGSESCVGTFARTGTSSYVYTFTDPDMVHTNSSSSYDLYYYDVRAYYSPDGTYSDYDFKAVYAEMGGPIADDSPNEERMQIAEKIYEYGISNYPNPYNPTTTINYQIKEMGNVNITVFDALGRTVKVLVNDIKQPGDYNILFDGSNLSNGVYYYRMNSGKFVETKKMIMMK